MTSVDWAVSLHCLLSLRRMRNSSSRWISARHFLALHSTLSIRDQTCCYCGLARCFLLVMNGRVWGNASQEPRINQCRRYLHYSLLGLRFQRETLSVMQTVDRGTVDLISYEVVSLTPTQRTTVVPGTGIMTCVQTPPYGICWWVKCSVGRN